MGKFKKAWEFRNYKDSDGTEKRELYITGEIVEWSWWGDDTEADAFHDQLYGGTGDVDIWINSPGGDVFAAAKIYNDIAQYGKGKITAYVYGLCASAATVIIMAANKIYMSPTALMLIHNPYTIAIGESEDMKKTADQLDAVKETIINAYEKKTGLSRKELSEYMNKEKAFDATEAIELGFADGFIESEQDKFSTMDVTNSAMVRFYNSVKDWKLAFQSKVEPVEDTKEEEKMKDKDKKVPEVIDQASDVLEVQDKVVDVPKEPSAAAVVDVKDFESLASEFKAYKEKTAKEVSELREYKARQEAEFKAQALIGLPGISDERRIEIARTADEELFNELKAIATTMNELTEPIGAVVSDADVAEGKEEAELRKKIKDYATENNVTEQEAYQAVVNGGGK